MTEILTPDTLQPGDAFTVRQIDGPLAEAILWDRTADGDLLVTWATRGTDGFRASEGPKTASRPMLLRAGSYLGTNLGDGVMLHRAGEDTPMGMLVAITGHYKPRDPRASSVAILAAEYRRQIGREVPHPPTVTTYLDMRAAADRLGIDYATVRRYRAVDSFPPPDVQVGQSPGWTADTLDAWQAQRPGRGAGGGRPRKTHP